MPRLAPGAVLLGGVVDVALTGAVAIPLTIAACARAGVYALPQERQAQATAALLASPEIAALQVAVGCLCSVVAGWLTARLARHDAALNGAASAWLAVGIEVYGLLGDRSNPLPPAIGIASIVLAPLFGALGGLWWERGRRAHAGTDGGAARRR
jgi:hypothetical protein